MSGIKMLWSLVSLPQIVAGMVIGTGLAGLFNLYDHSRVTGPPVIDLRLRTVGLHLTETGILLAVESTFIKRRFCPAYIAWFAESEDVFQLDGLGGLPFRFPLTIAYPASADLGSETRITVLWLTLPPGDYLASPIGHFDCDDRSYPLLGVDGASTVPIRFSIVQRDGKLVCVLPN